MAFAFGADEVSHPRRPLVRTTQTARKWSCANPVSHVSAVAIELQTGTADDAGRMARDEFLHVLVEAVIVGAVGDGRVDAVGAVPRTNQQVRRGLGGVVGTRGPVGVIGLEAA